MKKLKNPIIILFELIICHTCFGQNLCNSRQLLIKNRIKSVSIFVSQIDSSKTIHEKLSLIFRYDTLGRRISVDHYNIAKNQFSGTQKFFYKDTTLIGIRTQDVSATGQIIYEKSLGQFEQFEFNTEYYSYSHKNYSCVLNDQELFSFYFLYPESDKLLTGRPEKILRFEYER